VRGQRCYNRAIVESKKVGEYFLVNGNKKMKNPFRRIGIFFGETINELKIASWPTQREMRRYVAVVLLGMVLLGIYVAIVDFSLIHVISSFSGWIRGSLGR
jgi:preprotein translocase SecE subunit